MFPVAAELFAPIKCTTVYFYAIFIGLQKAWEGGEPVCLGDSERFLFHTSLAVTN